MHRTMQAPIVDLEADPADEECRGDGGHGFLSQGDDPEQAREGERAHHEEAKRSDQLPSELSVGQGQIEDAPFGAEPGFESESNAGENCDESAENGSTQAHEFQIRELFDNFGHGRSENLASYSGASELD